MKIKYKNIFYYVFMDIEIICRQTNYTEEEAKLKLEHHGTVENVIREFIEPRPILKPKITDNQVIYREINTHMNEVFKTRN